MCPKDFVGVLSYGVQPDGLMVNDGKGSGRVGGPSSAYTQLFPSLFSSPQAQQWMAAICTMHTPVLLATSFMHCINVETNEVRGRYARRERRERQATSGSDIRFHVLDIEPMKRTLRTEGHSDELGIKKAMHICRGHFKNLQHERFKNKGLHWWPMHVRGNPSLGAVDKDYSVSPPK